MIDPLVTTDVLLGSGLVGATVGLVQQTRAKHAEARAARDARRELLAMQKRFGDLDTETQHLAEKRLPALVDAVARGHRGIDVPGLLNAALAGTPTDAHHQAILALARQAAEITRRDIGLAARSAVREVVGEAQTFLVRCQMKALEEMNKFPEGTAYHQSLFDFDRLVTRALHTVQRLLILTGSWPGLQRADCTMREIVQSACGRIDDDQRVDYRYDPRTAELWVEGRVVEPITVTLTELLSNATSCSGGKVIVEVQQVGTGYIITVDDAGLNMNAYQRAEAARLLSQRTVLDVTTLPDSHHLGFPVIGRLCADYGFRADVNMTSAFGGVRAVLLIPHELLGQGPSEQELEAERQAALRATAPSTPLPPEQHQAAPAGGPSGLPQRRRSRPRPAAAASPSAGAAAPEEDPETFTSGLADFSRVLREGETTHEGDDGRHA